MRELLRKLWFRTTVDGFGSSLYIAIEITTKTISFFDFYTQTLRGMSYLTLQSWLIFFWN